MSNCLPCCCPSRNFLALAGPGYYPELALTSIKRHRVALYESLTLAIILPNFQPQTCIRTLRILHPSRKDKKQDLAISPRLTRHRPKD
ncbi:hypothetical protein DUNSADRAFT_5393 [Dunaliella salina]|uniref:Encoded protein n=1 Tax=Dunaliella salina TaxID=3046 RepID=A0ABQ7GQC8_DUNSA|nr:hypothetical protein DUNSADRAFT_5393 [Dunaliella salina]|eukprot:KAF5836814.1 hypothetical protein DUNSADRAFT_5393 [Dunaliella salina]